MRRSAPTWIDRLKLLIQLAIVLAAFAPAVSAHACAEPNCATVVSVGQAASDQDQGCLDCGPACANGCCHAPHPAATTEPAPIQPPTAAPLRHAWLQTPEPPPVEPSGPRRPPRA